MTDQTVGAPYGPADRGQADPWSEAMYDRLQAWEPARSGAWSLWPPGYLLLEITRHAEREIEPVLIYTADEEITVTFGYWEAHFDELTQGDEDTALEAALQTVEGWLDGRVRTVVSFKADGSWCGSSLLEESDDIAAVRRHIEWILDFDPARVQIRSSKREDWREIEVSPEWSA